MSLKKLLIAFVSLLLFSCASGYKNTYRKTASDETPKPPLGTIQPTWLYSWTNRLESNDPAAVKAFIRSGLQHAQQCLEKLTPDASFPVEHCEGNGFAAGPGIYTCDNPFTSHDYGNTVVAVKVEANEQAKVPLVTGSFTPPPASGGIDREIYGVKEYSGLIYNFRYSDINTRALVVRNENMFQLENPASSFAVSLKNLPWKKFAAHESFICDADTSIAEMLTKWGDHIEFMARVYNSSFDPSGGSFLNGSELNDYAIVAAVASDMVARSEADLVQLIKKIPKTQTTEWANECQDSASVSLRSCLSHRLFHSLLEEKGTDKNPTYNWTMSETRSALNILDPSKSRIFNQLRSKKETLGILVKAYRADRAAMEKIQQAYSCAMIAKEQNKQNNLDKWGEDPQ